MESVLTKLGLTESEVKVYSNLLELGSCTSGAIIKKTSLQSSTIYHALEFLIKKGMVSYVVKNNRKYYEASDPENLLKIIEEKRKELQNQENAVKNIIPQLIEKQKISKKKSEATIYEGYKGIKAVFEDILKTLDKGDVYYVFGARGGLPLKWTRNFFIQFNKRRVKKGIKKKIIFNEEVKDITGKDEENLPLTIVRYISQTTPSAVNIYGDKVIIALWTEQPLAFLIRSKEVAQSYLQYFNSLWKAAHKL
ncbi:MAG: BlaI/MecI/CopY family transcriptional regulator [Nanoarchaeota archaeon]|nr:BlaI/MecI/CopY family transcriptional regulator [Nanoarchaeota archaeon]